MAAKKRILKNVTKKTARSRPTRGQAARGGRQSKPASVDRPEPLQPNMLMVNADAASSTFSRIRYDHSVIADTRFLNCLFHQCNFEGSSFTGCDLDGSVIENGSLRAVELRNCDVEGLVINGVRVGDLINGLVGTKLEEA